MNKLSILATVSYIAFSGATFASNSQPFDCEIPKSFTTGGVTCPVAQAIEDHHIENNHNPALQLVALEVLNMYNKIGFQDAHKELAHKVSPRERTRNPSTFELDSPEKLNQSSKDLLASLTRDSLTPFMIDGKALLSQRHQGVMYSLENFKGNLSDLSFKAPQLTGNQMFNFFQEQAYYDFIYVSEFPVLTVTADNRGDALQNLLENTSFLEKKLRGKLDMQYRDFHLVFKEVLHTDLKGDVHLFTSPKIDPYLNALGGLGLLLTKRIEMEYLFDGAPQGTEPENLDQLRTILFGGDEESYLNSLRFLGRALHKDPIHDKQPGVVGVTTPDANLLDALYDSTAMILRMKLNLMALAGVQEVIEQEMNF
jgi:hypothetical protein